MFLLGYAVPLLILCRSSLCCQHEVEASNSNTKRVERNVFNTEFAEQSQSKGYVLEEWLKEDYHLGQVNGITIDDNGFIYLFHRSDRIWNMNTFNVNNLFMQTDLGPITNATILIFHSNGTLISSRGKRMFYMPHGIFVDQYFNIWVTDVALHQVMKLPSNSDNPLLTLGEAFKPGQDTAHFCKPTSVAVLRETNDFFVADGYCNFRILKYNSKGVKLLEWGRSSASTNGHIPGYYEFFIPHALTIVEEKSFLCVADRQNGRVLCYNASNGNFTLEIFNPSAIGSLIYSASYSPAHGGQLFLVNGPSDSNIVQGFAVSLENKINSRFGSGYLQFPHDIAVSNDSLTVYVAELKPPRVSKFVLRKDDDTIKSNDSSFLQIQKIVSPNEEGKLTGALLIITSCFVFAAAIIIATFVYTKNKKSGCSWWLKNGSSEGFKLGNILGHQGFEQLNQGAESDEDQALA